MDALANMIDTYDLRRSFGEKEAVAGITFHARKGEIFGLLGPNGAGKTTTIRLLTGQIEPSGGSATVAGCDVVRDRARLKERIGVVFEEQNLYERLTARRNLLFSCWLYNLPESRIDETLDLVRLRDRAKEPVRAYSHGMRQRLMIARALLHRPSALFLDELSLGLDPIAAREVRQVVKQLARDGTTVLLATHLMEEADLLCDRVAFIVNGRLVASDTPGNLKLAHGRRALVVTMMDEHSGLDGNSPEEITMSIDDAAEQARLAQWMTEGKVRAIHSREATLEEVFIEVAGVRPA